MLSPRNKVRGMFLGAAIGDRLGMPAEGMTPKQIAETYGKITFYRKPKRNWKNKKAGTGTDDEQLTLATARAFIKAKKFNMKTIAQEHVAAFKEGTEGWGRGTKRAVEKLQALPWTHSAIRDASQLGLGAGNGVSMKISPLAAHSFLKSRRNIDYFIKFSIMTHYTYLAIQSAVAQGWALLYCLKHQPNDFLKDDDFFGFIWDALQGLEGKSSIPADIGRDNYDLKRPVSDFMSKPWLLTADEARQKFGNGSCFVYNSLPFSLYFFRHNPFAFDSLINVINAGGDTDTNGSQVGALLGALNGEDVFPAKVMKNVDYIIDVADKFTKTFE